MEELDVTMSGRDATEILARSLREIAARYAGRNKALADDLFQEMAVELLETGLREPAKAKEFWLNAAECRCRRYVNKEAAETRMRSVVKKASAMSLRNRTGKMGAWQDRISEQD